MDPGADLLPAAGWDVPPVARTGCRRGALSVDVGGIGVVWGLDGAGARCWWRMEGRVAGRRGLGGDLQGLTEDAASPGVAAVNADVKAGLLELLFDIDFA